MAMGLPLVHGEMTSERTMRLARAGKPGQFLRTGIAGRVG